jgi:hypothetical protein
MRKLLFAAIAGAALACGSTAANAAALVTNPDSLTPPASALFGNTFNGVAPGTFSDTFAFTIGGTDPASANAEVSTIAFMGSQNVSFIDGATCPTCSIFIDVDDAAHRFIQTGFDPNPEVWDLVAPLVLAAGEHTIFVNGQLTGPSGAYAGTLNIQAVQGVPEPATWALMLLGFGGVGMVLRRRRRPALAQLA